MTKSGQSLQRKTDDEADKSTVRFCRSMTID